MRLHSELVSVFLSVTADSELECGAEVSSARLKDLGYLRDPLQCQRGGDHVGVGQRMHYIDYPFLKVTHSGW
jgi:hypothetical protein